MCEKTPVFHHFSHAVLSKRFTPMDYYVCWVFIKSVCQCYISAVTEEGLRKVFIMSI